MMYEKVTTLKVSKELTTALKILGVKGQSYEDIIWRLLKENAESVSE